MHVLDKDTTDMTADSKHPLVTWAYYIIWIPDPVNSSCSRPAWRKLCAVNLAPSTLTWRANHQPYRKRMEKVEPICWTLEQVIDGDVLKEALSGLGLPFTRREWYSSKHLWIFSWFSWVIYECRSVSSKRMGATPWPPGCSARPLRTLIRWSLPPAVSHVGGLWDACSAVPQWGDSEKGIALRQLRQWLEIECWSSFSLS